MSERCKLLNTDSKVVYKTSRYINDPITAKVTMEIPTDYPGLIRFYLSLTFKTIPR